MRSVIIPIASFTMTVFLSGYIAASGKGSRANKAFLVYAASIAAWALAELILAHPISSTTAGIVLRVSSIFFLSSSFLFLNFVYALVERKFDKIYGIFATTVFACISAVVATDLYHAPQAVRHGSIFILKRMPTANIIDLLCLSPSLYALHLILKLYLSDPRPKQRIQLILVLTGLCVTFAGSILYMILLPLLKILPPGSHPPSLLGALFIAFIFVATVRFRFLSDSVELVARHLFSRMKECAIVLDRNRRIVAANDSARRLLGIKDDVTLVAEQILPLPYRFDEDCTDLPVEIIAEGKKKQLLVTQMTLMEVDGPAGRLVIVNDVTEERETATALRESKEMFASAFNASPIPLAINHVVSGNYIDVNEAMTASSGYTREEFIGRTPAGMGIFADREELISFVKLLAAHRKVRGFECRLRRKNGTIAECSISAEPLTIRGEEYVITATVDISEQKRTARMIKEQYEEIQAQYNVLEVMNEELARTHRDITETNRVLAREKERLAATLRAIGEGVITTDIEGSVELINTIGERITGYGAAAAVGCSVWDVLPITCHTTGMTCRDMVYRVLKNGEIVEMRVNTTMTSEDGSIRHISAIGAPIRDEKSRIDGAIVVFRDITDRVRMEEELIRASKLDSLAVFAGGIAHDFNNLLTSITGNISLARLTTPDDDPFQAVLSEIETAAKRAKDLTLQLLTFSRGGAPIRQATSVPALLHDTAEFVSRGTPVRCVFEIAENLRHADIDEGQISQVIQNLILNAVQAMPEGGTVTISARNVTQEEATRQSLPSSDYLCISVSDEGPGIDERHIDRIFDPFFTTKEHGTGLGLAVTYSIVTKHGGRINVRTQRGKGTTFDIYLPATDEAPREEPASPEMHISASGRILIMDDEDLVLATASRILRHMGYDVTTAHNGEEAIRAYRVAREKGNPFDVVIMDLTVQGGMGGKDAMAVLVNIDPGIRAIVSSGYSTDPVMAHYREYGFKGVVVKPYKYEELAAVLQAIMNEMDVSENPTAL